MALDENAKRAEAWTQALYAQGTYTVFASRAARLKLLTDLRDFFGLLAIPISTAFVATAELTAVLAPYRKPALIALSGAAAVQAMLAGWSLIRRWDDERAYCSRAMRDSNEMKVAWQEIGKGDVRNIATEYDLRKAQQKIIDSHDIGRDISERERRLGMHSGLFEFQKACVGCDAIPNSMKPPWFIWNRCGVCGGKEKSRG